MPVARRTRRRLSEDYYADCPLPKRHPDAEARELEEEIRLRELRAAVRAQCYHEDGGKCRRCSWRWDNRLPDTRLPRTLMLMTDNIGKLAHAHEVDFRSTGGDPRDPRNILTVCWQCHPILQEHREDVIVLDPARGCRGPVEFRPRAAYGLGTHRTPNPRVHPTQRTPNGGDIDIQFQGPGRMYLGDPPAFVGYVDMDRVVNNDLGQAAVVEPHDAEGDAQRSRNILQALTQAAIDEEPPF
jgi:hypothetical protein